jgi:hypothetical protein
MASSLLLLLLHWDAYAMAAPAAVTDCTSLEAE